MTCSAYSRLGYDSLDDVLRGLAAPETRPGVRALLAEYAGEVLPGERAAACLLPLLRHADACVREGALLGLWEHAARADVLAALAFVRDNDRSAIIRSIAAECIEAAQ